MSLYERMLVPIFWTNNAYGYDGAVLKNLNLINDDYLSKGWEVERVDELNDAEGIALMYILRKEKDGKE